MTVGLCSLWHNTPELLTEFERLLTPGGWDDAILVDNASDPDAKRAYQLTAERAGCKVLAMATNDVLKGWNAGMAALDTDIKVLMGSDLIMQDPAWLLNLARWVMPGVMVGPYMKQWIDGQRYLDGTLIACHVIDWQRLGGLDEGYTHPGYVSDVDLCWRAGEAGIQLRKLIPSGVLHLGNYTTGLRKDQVHPTWYANRDRLLAKKAAKNGAK